LTSRVAPSTFTDVPTDSWVVPTTARPIIPGTRYIVSQTTPHLRDGALTRQGPGLLEKRSKMQQEFKSHIVPGIDCPGIGAPIIPKYEVHDMNSPFFCYGRASAISPSRLQRIFFFCWQPPISSLESIPLTPKEATGQARSGRISVERQLRSGEDAGLAPCKREWAIAKRMVSLSERINVPPFTGRQ
jgi:hypothetical protein